MLVIHVSESFYISKSFFCRILAEGSSFWKGRTPEWNLEEAISGSKHGKHVINSLYIMIYYDITAECCLQ